MDETDLDRLSRDIAALKASIKHSDPALREIGNARGWGTVSLFGAFSVSLFSLSAHILSAKYGSLAALPPVWRAFLWASLALFLVGSGACKMIVLYRAAARTTPRLGWGDILESLYSGPLLHVQIPSLLGAVVGSAFAVSIGRPWYALPVSAVFLTFWTNGFGFVSGVREFQVLGWWCFLSGSLGLFFVERAPFLWLFAILGGMLYAFAGALFLGARLREKGE